ncbi:MAG: nuclear transport factor 2 family protein [Chloroflexota bacterium]
MSTIAERNDYWLIERWFRHLFTQGEIEKPDELVTPDFVTRDPSGKLGAANPEAFKTWLRWYLSHFTERTWTLHDVIRSEDKVIVRYSGQVTYQGGLFEIPSTHQRITEMGILIFRIREGRIAELWSALSDLELVLELGAIPVVRGVRS